MSYDKFNYVLVEEEEAVTEAGTGFPAVTNQRVKTAANLCRANKLGMYGSRVIWSLLNLLPKSHKIFPTPCHQWEKERRWKSSQVACAVG